jgi:Glycosyl hydrolase family 59
LNKNFLAADKSKVIPMPQRTMILCGSIFLVVSLLVTMSSSAQGPKQIVLDGQSTGARFDGLGAVSAGASSRLLVDYPEPYRSQILDYLFKPGFGAALQHLKVEVGSDVNSTDGSEPSHMRTPDDHDYTRGYEWWLMAEARKRNPKIILDTLAWGAPGWIGAGTFYSPDMANYIADFLQGAQKQYGLDIAYTGVWNEKVYDAAYVKQLHRTLQAKAGGTKLVCCDEYPGEGLGQWSIVDAMAKDAELRAAVDVVSVHYPQEKGKLTTTDSARGSGKPLWSSEDQPNSGGGPIVSRDWAIGGRILASLYNRNHLEGSMTNTQIWSPVTSYYDILAAPNSGLMYANTPWSGHYDVQSAIWVTAHTTQFAQPGWQYLDRSSGYLPDKGTYVSLRSPNRRDWSIVLETISAKAPQKLTFAVKGGLADGTVHVWETNGQKTFEKVADVAPHGGGFAYTFDPDSIYSITTTTGQGKGSVQPPPAHAFPLPYKDDFEKTALARAVRYLSDQDGAFEAHPCMGRGGQCLEQVIVKRPIPWGPLPDPFTLAGDVNWTDYYVDADMRFIDSGPITIMGRIDSANVFQDGKAIWPSGYILSVDNIGKWTLCSATYKQPIRTLASGTVQIGPDVWHSAKISFRGDTITAWIDQKQIATVHDSAHPHGMFGIGSGWQRAEFDNLVVAPN